MSNVRSRLSAYGRVPKELLRDPNISANAKTLYAIMDEIAGHEYLTMAKLGQWLGRTDRTARAAVAELRDAGWIETIEKYVAGRQVANEYICNEYPYQKDPPIEAETNSLQGPETSSRPRAETGFRPSTETRDYYPLTPTPTGAGEPKPPPQPKPLARCSKHEAPHPNCRGCGTTARAVAKRERAEQAHRERERQRLEARERQQARTTSTTSESPVAQRALTQMRESLRRARSAVGVSPGLAAESLSPTQPLSTPLLVC